MKHTKDELISEITGMIQREGEGLLNNEGVADWEVCKGVANDIVAEIVQPLITVNAELLEVLKAAKQLIGMHHSLETQFEAETINEILEAINKAEGGN